MFNRVLSSIWKIGYMDFGACLGMAVLVVSFHLNTEVLDSADDSFS